MPPSFADPIPAAPRPAWLRLADLLIAVLLVLAIALVTSFLGVNPARAASGQPISSAQPQEAA